MMRGTRRMKGYLKNPTATAEALRRRLVPHRRPRGDARRTAMSRSRTAPRTSSSPAARTSARSRSRTPSTATRPCSRLRWSRSPTRSGARAPAPSSRCKRGASATAEELIAHCRQSLARFKVPKTVVFGPLPKTSTGKIQKFQLREQARSSGRDRVRSAAMNARAEPQHAVTEPVVLVTRRRRHRAADDEPPEAVQRDLARDARRDAGALDAIAARSRRCARS